MVKSNTSALGIVFPNSYDSLVPELVSERLMASIPFASRYRLIDFMLSSMVNSGIDNISIVVRNNYHSLMDHLGSGREWDLTRKNGGLSIFPPYAEKSSKLYSGRVEALANILPFLRSQKEKYVVIADTNIAINFDFSAMIRAHVASGADVTVAYTKETLPESALKTQTNDAGYYYTFTIDDQNRVSKIYINSKEQGVQNFSLNIYVIDRELLIDLINTASVRGLVYFERDILAPRMDEIRMDGYCYDGYVARISDMQSYFEENMKLLDDANVDALFEGSPIYTKIRDDNPTRYINGAQVKNTMAADGCVIEGTVENSILFRGVRVAKGAVVRNCILMQDTVVEENADIDYIITDKRATITSDVQLKGTKTFPVYVAKHQVV